MATKWAEYKRKQREREKLEEADKAKEESMQTDEPHPVYPHLRKYSDRKYDKQGLVLFEQQCALCDGVWTASIAIPCPYCDGTGKRKRGPKA
jgi:hypothetical protein